MAESKVDMQPTKTSRVGVHDMLVQGRRCSVSIPRGHYFKVSHREDSLNGVI